MRFSWWKAWEMKGGLARWSSIEGLTLCPRLARLPEQVRGVSYTIVVVTHYSAW